MNRKQLKALLWVLIAPFISTLAGLGIIDSGLQMPSSPNGILSFELCGFTSSCDATLDQWGIKGQQLAMLSLGLDYLFLVIYPSLVCVGLLLVAALVPVQFRNLTTLLGWVALGAGFADAAENFFLIRIILSGSGASYGVLASTFSVIKFLIPGVTLAWLVFTSLAYGVRKKKA
ncbi:MAG: hypothetical protein ACU4EQ_08275 [Candidatus Nitrosoglobus sp.]